MCCHLVRVPSIEHKQSRFSIILKGPKIFRMVHKHCQALTVLSSCKIPSGIFFQYKTVPSTLKICLLVYSTVSGSSTISLWL
uniref:Uncharacterized protein n=1 Tax=Nothoprocta perdicaria TaxID=30464 RepID=A0A8C6ZQ26_NOTPE